MLSDGDRSTVMFALLVALGQVTGTPFHAMDEIGTDSATRKVTFEALVEMGKNMGHRQFILITPQDVSFVEPGPKVKIQKTSTA